MENAPTARVFVKRSPLYLLPMSRILLPCWLLWWVAGLSHVMNQRQMMLTCCFFLFSCLAYCQVKARLYDTALGYDIAKQRLTTSAENRIHKCISFFPPVGSKRFDYPPPCFRRRRALSIQGFSLQQETRSNLWIASPKTQHARLLVRHACCNTIHDFHFAFVSGNDFDHATFV